MKLLTVDRGHAKLEDGDKYTLYLYTMKHWQTPTGTVPVDASEQESIIKFLQSISEKNEPYLDLVFDP